MLVVAHQTPPSQIGPYRLVQGGGVAAGGIHQQQTVAEIKSVVEVLWAYHSMSHSPKLCDVGIGLSSLDLGVALVATGLSHRGMFPWLVFTGANAPTTTERFPQGEAVASRAYAIKHGVPAEVILLDSAATNTEQNIKFSRALLEEAGVNGHLCSVDVAAMSAASRLRDVQERLAAGGGDLLLVAACAG